MSKILLESDFLTFDLKSIYANNSQKSAEGAQKQGDPAAEDNAGQKSQTKPASKAKSASTRIDWSKELKKRLDANNELAPESRKKEFDIENEFWLEFFTVTFGATVAKLLNNIELLKKDIQILGFKKQSNPLITFFQNKYVQNALVVSKLINSNTYKAVHNAFAKRLVSDFEFLKANDYNILYCRDLYNRAPTEIEKYLELQKQVLPANVKAYDEETVIKNKKIFLDGNQKTVRAAAAKLKSQKEILSLYKLSAGKKAKSNETDKADTDAETEEDTLDTFDARTDLAAFVKTKEHTFTTLQYLGMTAKSQEALKALTSIDFGQLSSEKLIVASREVSAGMSRYRLTKDDVAEILDLIKRRARR
jgi:hypothetical protein